jgi:hypothetical protein
MYAYRRIRMCVRVALCGAGQAGACGRTGAGARGRVGARRGRCGCVPMGGGEGVGRGVGVGVAHRGSSTFVLEKVYKTARDYAGDCLYLAMEIKRCKSNHFQECEG